MGETKLKPKQNKNERELVSVINMNEHFHLFISSLALKFVLEIV